VGHEPRCSKHPALEDRLRARLLESAPSWCGTTQPRTSRTPAVARSRRHTARSVASQHHADRLPRDLQGRKRSRQTGEGSRSGDGPQRFRMMPATSPPPPGGSPPTDRPATSLGQRRKPRPARRENDGARSAKLPRGRKPGVEATRPPAGGVGHFATRFHHRGVRQTCSTKTNRSLVPCSPEETHRGAPCPNYLSLWWVM
jgi:hypothetical protein